MPEAILKRLDCFHEFRHKLVEGVILQMLKLFGGKSEMPSGKRTFKDDRAGRSLEALGPTTEDQFRTSCRADDGHQVHRRIVDDLGQPHRQSRSEDNHLDAFSNGCLKKVFDVAEHAHEIDSENALGHGSGLANLFLQSFTGDPLIVSLGRFEVSQADARDRADSPLFSHRRCQGCQRYPHAHPSLNDRDVRC